MRSIIHIFLAFLAATSIANCDPLQDYKYVVRQQGNYWEVYRGGGMLNRFWVNTGVGRIKIYTAWNRFDTQPRLPMRDILAYIWIRASGKPLSMLKSVHIVNANNAETKQAIAAARQATSNPRPRDFSVGRGDRGWNALIASPFYMSVNKMCDEWTSLTDKSVTSMKVMSAENSLDDLIIYIS